MDRRALLRINSPHGWTFGFIVNVVFWTLLTSSTSCRLAPKKGKYTASQHGWSRAYGPVVPHDSFPKDCSICHISENWHELREDFQFDHGKETGVTLVGAHRKAKCLRCHNDRGPVAVFARKGCAGCHEDYHRGALGSSCTQCHNEFSWNPDGQVAQHNRTRFPLVGAHTAVACFRCHPGAQVGNFNRAPTECEACHLQEAKLTKSPNHVVQGWVQNCDQCHQPFSWHGSRFDHSRFPLLGAHAVLDCSRCHQHGTFTGLSQDCSSCHLANYQATTNPNHALAGFSTNCQDCHTTVAWGDAHFTHQGITNSCALCHLPQFNATTAPDHRAQGFPTNCEACHLNTVAWTPATFNHSGITSGCVNCHLNNYNAASQPDHATLGFPMNCEACHHTSAWTPATFNHAGIATGCVQCHQTDYNSTTNPNHAASGFPTACESCHSTASWIPSIFSHAGIPSNCAQCHTIDYQSTSNPNHTAAGFPMNCESCHNTTTWTGATFNHTFPINSGPHKSFSCTECHQVPSNYSIVSCTHCHDHRQSKMDDKHSDVSGYVWANSACISCHPNGSH